MARPCAWRTARRVGGNVAYDLTFAAPKSVSVLAAADDEVVRSAVLGAHRAGVDAGDWAAANNLELAYVPFYASWLNRIEAQFTALRYFALDGPTTPATPPRRA